MCWWKKIRHFDFNHITGVPDTSAEEQQQQQQDKDELAERLRDAQNRLRWLEWQAQVHRQRQNERDR